MALCPPVTSRRVAKTRRHVQVWGMSNRDVIIVGGGLVGPLCAVALAQAGLRVTVVDALAKTSRTSRRFDGRSYALAHASVSMFEVLGLWDAMADEAQPILDIKVSDGRPGEGASPFFVHFDHAEIEEGPMGHMVEDRVLRGALLARMEDLGVEQVSGAQVTGWEPGRVTTDARKKDHRALGAPLVVACDGRQSPLAAMAGIRRRGWEYGQTSLVCALEHDLPHQGCAHQFFTPAGPLAILPLTGNRSSIVWTETRERAAQLQGGTEADYLAALRPVFGDFLGGISLLGERYAYPLGLSLAERLTGPRLALAGDSGHGIHPLAGQGFNLGVKDVAALAEVVVDARRRGEDIGASDVLDRYQQWRRFDTALMAAATDGINRLFSNDNPLLRTARDLGLGAVTRIPALRRGFMRHAAGLTGDRPKLLQGQAI